MNNLAAEVRGFWKILLLCAFFAIANVAQAFSDELKVGLFYKESIQSVSLSANDGGYTVSADGVFLFDLAEGQALTVAARGEKVSLKTSAKAYGHFSSVRLVRKKWGNTFKLKSLSPSKKTRIYNDNIRILPDGPKLKLINDVYVEHYVAGVVEAESGKGRTLEYYKVQAIIARTYALHNLDKFKAEGYELCDKVDCQVYRGKSRHDANIPKAVFETNSMVLVDSDINLITAAFHSNSGGYTCNSEDVWSSPLPYLKATPDSFSLGQPNANWNKTISKTEWLNYLQKTFDYPINDPDYLDHALDYCPAQREKFLQPFNDKAVDMTKVRRDWGLRSHFFTIQLVNDTVHFKGRGFGHGVGLSQEGAMHMARAGYTFTEILHYYYKNVHLVDLSVVDFFREE